MITTITTSNEKFGLNIDEQIAHLKKNKNIDFEENEEDAKNYLLKHSYADVITPVKVLFSSGYCEEKKCHLYNTSTKWKDIRRIHEELQELETTLLQASLSLELELKSVFCTWLSDYLKTENIDFISFLKQLENQKTVEENVTFFDFKDATYSKIYHEGYKDYVGTTYNNRWWLLIMELTFGEFRYLVKAHHKTIKKSILSNILSQTNIEAKINLNTLQILRNTLAHNTNILIFLDKPLRLNNSSQYSTRKKSIQALLHYSESTPLSSNGIISQYKQLRNNPNTNFKNLKI